MQLSRSNWRVGDSSKPMLPIEMAAEQGWLTPSAAARELGLSVSWVKTLIEQGKLEAQRTVLGRLIDPKSVAKLKAERAK